MTRGSDRARGDPDGISVIIPVHNDHARLAQALDAIKVQDTAALEVLVVDNRSDPPLPDRFPAHPAVRILREDRPGSYAARNRALQEARGSILAFTDSDCIPRPDWLTMIRHHLAQQPDAVLAGRVEVVAPPGADAGRAFDAATAFPVERYVRKAHYGVTANLAARAATFARVGPFDAELKSSGDRLWCQRAHAAGHTVVYVPDAVVGHPPRDKAEILHKARRVEAGLVARRSKARRLAHAARRWAQLPVPPTRELGRLRDTARATGVPLHRLLGVWYALRATRARAATRLALQSPGEP